MVSVFILAEHDPKRPPGLLATTLNYRAAVLSDIPGWERGPAVERDVAPTSKNDAERSTP